MPEQANEQPTPALPTSHPFAPVSMVETSENDDDPGEIFLNAVAEIDTQPLVAVKSKRTGTVTLADVLEVLFLVSVLCFALLGSFYLAVTYPHTLVILYAKTYPAHLTTTLDLPTRTLARVTVTRSATAATTGHGHQDARAATGPVRVYNGSTNPQSLPAGTVFQGQDGVQVSTEQPVTIPAANLPQVGEATVQATAILPGSQGNIQAFDINSALSSVLKVRNEASFTNGRDARTYRAVAPQDLATLTSTLRNDLTQQIPQAFSSRPGEAVHETACTTKTAADHISGDEANSITVKVSATCQGVAYSQDALQHKATAAFTKTRPGAQYHHIGNVQASLQNVSPLTIAISGKWVYAFTPDYQGSLAEQIQGESPQQARAYLLKTGVIADASIPNTNKLPPVGYIDFLVLTG